MLIYFHLVLLNERAPCFCVLNDDTIDDRSACISVKSDTSYCVCGFESSLDSKAD